MKLPPLFRSHLFARHLVVAGEDQADAREDGRDEEIAVALAHGYARAKGKPMAAAVHNVVGLQHASMAIYNAWADRLPVIVLGGTGPMESGTGGGTVGPWADACPGGSLRVFTPPRWVL